MEYYGNAKIIESLSELPKIGDTMFPTGKCSSVEMMDEYEAGGGIDDHDGYVFYKVKYLDGKFIDTDINICYFTYAIKAENIKFDAEAEESDGMNGTPDKTSEHWEELHGKFRTVREILNDLDSPVARIAYKKSYKKPWKFYKEHTPEKAVRILMDESRAEYLK